ncbi:MAG TPA: radical SAM family heme chaperone HemW, partial [Williamwhitmania sp.]|nr:radical SAM family heme chaperone HemW [Williamwhitmania sp.]
MAGIYLHIPFCRHKCLYCDFYSVASLTQKDLMVASLCNEIDLRKDYLAEKVVDTIYFGGGTPSVLTAGDVGQILDRIKCHFSINDNVEVTLEANPEDLSATFLQELYLVGVNRLSIGIQSFYDDHLRYFGRHHSAAQAIDAFNAARNAGFNNISIDLIYGFPGLELEQWERNVEMAIELSAEHISAYQLMVEPGSLFFKRQQQGNFVPANDEESIRHYQQLTTRLRSVGYEHYELSNFCKPGYESRHNSSYWYGAHYLGLGPAAHSYNSESRQWNAANNKQYLDGISSGRLAFEIEYLSEAEKYNELLLTRLRTSRGLLRTELDGLSIQTRKFFENQVRKMLNVGLV